MRFIKKSPAQPPAGAGTAQAPAPAEPAQPPAQPAPPAAADTGAPLGGGLNQQTNYSLDFAFADAMKTAGEYRALNGDGGVNMNASAPVDAKGWPTDVCEMEIFTLTSG